MRILPKLSQTLILAACSLFCGLGFLASFESPGFPVYRLLFAAIVAACVVALPCVWLVKPAELRAGRSTPRRKARVQG